MSIHFLNTHGLHATFKLVNRTGWYDLRNICFPQPETHHIYYCVAVNSKGTLWQHSGEGDTQAQTNCILQSMSTPKPDPCVSWGWENVPPLKKSIYSCSQHSILQFPNTQSLKVHFYRRWKITALIIKQNISFYIWSGIFFPIPRTHHSVEWFFFFFWRRGKKPQVFFLVQIHLMGWGFKKRQNQYISTIPPSRPFCM